MYLALDLGTHLGWATFNSRGLLLASGTAHLQTGWKRYEGFLGFLVNFQPKAVFYEKVMRHKGTQAAHVYGALEGFLMWHYGKQGVPLEGLGVTAVKRHITGKGNAGKTAIIEAVNARLDLGLGTKEHNEADAIAVGLYGIAQRKGRKEHA